MWTFGHILENYLYNLFMISIDTIISIIKMLTQTQKQILMFLIGNPEEQLTIRGLSKRLNKSYTLMYNNIHDLEKKNIIVKQKVPPAQIIKLNEFVDVEISIEIELIRKNLFLMEQPWIKLMLKDLLTSVNNPFFIILVFGSYAKEKQTINSDLDSDVSIHVIKDDPLEDAIEDGMHV